MIKMILAIDQGNAIGWTDGRLPWKIPSDLKRFKELTTGHNVVMGFRTFLSLNRKDGLPHRKNYVLTKNAEKARQHLGDGVLVTESLEQIVCLNYNNPDQTYWIIGGATVYDQALSMGIVDEIYMTRVQERSGADVTLSQDLYWWKLFIIRQRKLGFNWEVTEMSTPQTPDGVPIMYLKLTRVKSMLERAREYFNLSLKYFSLN